MNDVRPHERDTPLVWQSLALFPFLNARENVEFGLKMRNQSPAVRRNNTISGNVRSIDDNQLQVDAPMGSFTVPIGDTDAVSETLSIGDTVTFVIAADLVQATRSITNAENSVECSLISEEFVGSMVTLFLETSDCTEFKVQLQERELVTLEHTSPGAFYVSWQSSSAHLLS